MIGAVMRLLLSHLQNLDLMWSTDLLAFQENIGSSDMLERSVKPYMTSLLAPDLERNGSGSLFSDDDEPDTDSMSYSRSLSSLTVDNELTNRKRRGFSHKQ
jgi:hypothetical protein